MKEIMRIAREQIDSLLTPEQRAEMQQIRDRREREGKGR
jgi:Spy/CpxP family protein refolding chaperone